MTNKKTVSTMYLVYFLSMAMFTGIRIVSSLGVFSDLHSDIASMVYTVIIQGFIMFLIPFSIYSIINSKTGGMKQTLAEAGYKKVKPKVIVIAIALGIIAFFINIAVSTIFGSIISFFGYQTPTSDTVSDSPFLSPIWQFVVDMVLVAVLPALCEEFLHRGLLLNKISSIGYKKAILISALMFGLIHFNINQFFYAFALGILMGFVTVISKTIWPAVIIHFINNGISVYLTYARANGWFGGNFYEFINSYLQNQSVLLAFVSTFLLLVLIGLVVVYLVFALFKETTIYNVNKAIDNVFKSGEDTKPYNPTYTPSMVEKHKILNDMLLTKSTLNVNLGENASPLDIMLPVNREQFNPNMYDNIFLIATIILGGLITVFTFIWGVL